MEDIITLFLCGDVMTGRGIDQILPHPSKPDLYEPYVRDARQYLKLAQEKNGPIQHPVTYSYIWGHALEVLERVLPDLRIINLETAVTASTQPWPGKGINYRMHPANIPCITAAKIDCCVMSNNHVLDWGYAGLLETLDTIHALTVNTTGAGKNREEAEAVAIRDVPEKRRVLVLGLGSETSGIPWNWAATDEKPGVNLLPDLSNWVAEAVGEHLAAVRKQDDLTVVSIHWGGNWGYNISREEQMLARTLIDLGADLIHGHSSHHVKGIEVYQGKLILYGCGDFLNDYEGIEGYEEFRDDLGLMYFPTLDMKTGRLLELRLTPTQIRHFRVNRANVSDAKWLAKVLTREGERFGTQVKFGKEDDLFLLWH